MKDSNVVSNLLGTKLLSGWTMLGDICANCNVPLMRKPNSTWMECVSCEKGGDTLKIFDEIKKEVSTEASSDNHQNKQNNNEKIDEDLQDFEKISKAQEEYYYDGKDFELIEEEDEDVKEEKQNENKRQIVINKTSINNNENNNNKKIANKDNNINANKNINNINQNNNANFTKNNNTNCNDDLYQARKRGFENSLKNLYQQLEKLTGEGKFDVARNYLHTIKDVELYYFPQNN